MSGRRLLLLYSAYQKPYKKRLTYITSTGTQYLALGNLDQADTFEFKFVLTATTATQAIFGNLSNGTGIFFGTAADGKVYANHTGVAAGNISLTTNTEYSVIQCNESVVVNGQTATVPAPVAHTLNTYLFCRNGNGSPERLMSGRVFYFKAYMNGSAILDLIPVLDRQNRPCMFDRISAAYFYNQGSGSFSY